MALVGNYAFSDTGSFGITVNFTDVRSHKIGFIKESFYKWYVDADAFFDQTIYDLPYAYKLFFRTIRFSTYDDSSERLVLTRRSV